MNKNDIINALRSAVDVSLTENKLNFELLFDNQANSILKLFENNHLIEKVVFNESSRSRELDNVAYLNMRTARQNTLSFNNVICGFLFLHSLNLSCNIVKYDGKIAFTFPKFGELGSIRLTKSGGITLFSARNDVTQYLFKTLILSQDKKARRKRYILHLEKIDNYTFVVDSID